MKKHDEGYILAYVFVILVVICIIAASVLTIPLANLRTQKAAVARMQNQYEAAGAVEEVLSRMNQQVERLGRNMTYTDLTTAKTGVLTELTAVAAGVNDPDAGMEGVQVTLSDWPASVTGDYTSSYTFHMTVTKGVVTITCEVVLQDIVSYDLVDRNYQVHVPLIEYNAYTITEAVGGGD